MNAPANTSACHLFCHGCGYALIGLPGNRCPECGRDFDPANPHTFLTHPRRVALRRIIRIVLVLLCLALAPGGYVLLPLEATYTEAFAALPRRWRVVLEQASD